MFLSEILIKEGLAAYKTQFEIKQEATLTKKLVRFYRYIVLLQWY